MFATEQQQGRVCATLTARLHSGPYWKPDEVGVPRPTDHAVRVVAGRTGMSECEVLLVRIAWGIWRGDSFMPITRATSRARVRRQPIDMGTMFHRLDRSNMRMVGSLLVALSERWEPGAPAIEQWLYEWSHIYRCGDCGLRVAGPLVHFCESCARRWTTGQRETAP